MIKNSRHLRADGRVISGRLFFPEFPETHHVFGANPPFSEDTPAIFHLLGPLETKKI